MGRDVRERSEVQETPSADPEDTFENERRSFLSKHPGADGPKKIQWGTHRQMQAEVSTGKK
jgi:hypothetical protein